MDQTHGGTIGGWDPSSFPGEAWDHHQFGGSSLVFDQGAPADSSYPNPDFLDAGAINPQLSGPDAQSGLYRPFDYYSQGDVWTGHAQPTTTAPYAQDPSLQQGYYAQPPQRHPNDANQPIDSRFALDIQQGNEFQPQIHGAGNQQQTNSHHGFSHGVINGPSSASGGFPQNPIPQQWQEQVPAGYAAGHQYENPLVAAQASHVSAPVSNAPSNSFFPGHGPSPSPMPGYQTEVRQHVPVNGRPAHPQFTAALNGQAQRPVPAAGSPHVPQQQQVRTAAGQQVPQQVFQQVPQQVPPQNSHHVVAPHQPSQQQPVQKTVQQPVQQRPPLQPASQSSAGQHVSAQQPATQLQQTQQAQPAPGTNAVAGIKRATASDPQAAPTVAKKAKVLAQAAASTPSPSAQPQVQPQAQPQTLPAPICTINFQDTALLAGAKGRPELRWAGVPNLVIGAEPVKLQKGTPTKRYVTLATKGGKDPLFSKMWRAWTPAESLGNHADAYQKATNDLARQQADIRLDVEMKRGKSEIPVDWWKKGLKDRLGKESKRLDPPPEPELTTLKTVEYLRVHPAHLRNINVTSDVCTDFAAFLQAKGAEVKTALQAAAEKKQDDKAEVKARTAKEQLEGAIVEGLRVEPDSLFARLSRSNKLLAILTNVLVRLFNAGEANSSLTKAILRLYTRFTRLTSEQLEKLQMDKMKKKFAKEGDAEAKGLMTQLFENARKNDEEDSESGSDSPSGKKAARQPSKQGTSGSDLKKSVTSSTSKLGTSATTKTMASSNEQTKAASKAPQQGPSTATGTKRSREDDTAGADARLSKKVATDTTTSAGNAKGPLGTKSLAVGAGKPTTTTKSTTTSAASGSTAAQPKPRSALLLPGKTRPVSKPAPKPEPAKSEAQKSAAKPESTLKGLPAKTAPTAKPKPAEAPKQASSATSIFSSLMKEIDEKEKIIKTPTASKKANQPDPNETPEQRERRLRKEKRRGLRVAFKAGDALVEVREFTRHPEEIDDGHLARSVRTDGRYKNSEESEMMKRLHGGQGIRAEEVNDREWEKPTPINFGANIPKEKMEQTYNTRGGLKTFETDEQKATREREANELMVIYHNRADIPPTPRSPPYEPSLSGDAAAHEVHLPPTAPEYDELMQRIREFRQWGPYHASRAAQSRLDTKARPDYADFTKTLKSINSIADSYNGQAPRQPDARVQQQQQPAQPIVQAAGQDPRKWYDPAVTVRRDQQTHDLLASDRAKKWQDPDPYNRTLPRSMTQEDLDKEPKLQQVLANLKAIAESVRASQPAKPAQAEAPAPQPAQPEASQAAAANPDHAAAWAQYYAAQQQQAAWYAQQQNAYAQGGTAYPGAQAPQAAQQQQAADPTSQYAGILAALGIAQPGPQPQPAAPAADQNSQIQAALMALAAGNQAQPAAPAASDPNSQIQAALMALAASNQAQPAAPAAGYQAQYPYPGANPAQPYGQGYGQTHPDRDAYVQGYNNPDRERERERDGYGRDRDRERDRDNRERERDRDRDGGYHHPNPKKGRNNNNNNNNSGGGGGGGGKNENVPEHLRGINRSLIGTKACAFWAKGQCAKGEKCTFRHD